MNIVKNLVDESKYGIKCPYEMEATRIVVHETANDASAKNEIAYMIRNDKETSFHYAVDDVEVRQGIPENRNAWHAGDGGKGKGNREGLAIEICYSKSGGERWRKSVDNAAQFIAQKLKEKGWGVDKVTKHQDYSGKHCPHRILDEFGWETFLDLVDSYLHPVTPLYRVRKSWKDAASQIGAYKVLKNAIAACKPGYSVFDGEGRAVYIMDAPAPKTIGKGSKVKVKSGAKDYKGGKLASFVYKTVYTVLEEPKGERAVIGLNGVVTAAVNVKDLILQ